MVANIQELLYLAPWLLIFKSSLFSPLVANIQDLL